MTDPTDAPDIGAACKILTPADDDWLEQANAAVPQPGLYLGIPNFVYHQGWQIPSQSVMKPAILKTPAHAKYQQDADDNLTAAKDIGQALHTRVLEPEHFERDIVEYTDYKTRTAKAWIAMAAANPLKTYVTPAEREAVIVMADRLHEIPEVRRLQSERVGSWRELSVVADLTGNYPAILDGDQKPFTMRVKCRFDWLTHGIWWNSDIKSSRDATEDAFDKQVKERGYHIQAGFYEMVAAAVPEPVEVRKTMYAIVENAAPFEPVFREIAPEALDRGRVLAHKMVALWAWCTQHNMYPGFPPGIGIANLPKWALGVDYVNSVWDEEIS